MGVGDHPWGWGTTQDARTAFENVQYDPSESMLSNMTKYRQQYDRMTISCEGTHMVCAMSGLNGKIQKYKGIDGYVLRFRAILSQPDALPLS